MCLPILNLNLNLAVLPYFCMGRPSATHWLVNRKTVFSACSKSNNWIVPFTKLAWEEATFLKSDIRTADIQFGNIVAASQDCLPASSLGTAILKLTSGTLFVRLKVWMFNCLTVLLNYCQNFNLLNYSMFFLLQNFKSQFIWP